MHRFTRRQALVGGALSLASLAFVGGRLAAAQLLDRPQFLMFHVEAGW